MRTAVITFVYNEQVNLPIWRSYFAPVFGEENLFVVDHQSTDGSTDNLGRINKIFLYRGELDEHKRCVFMASFQRALLEYFDVVIYTDCDEIIVPDTTKYRDLADYIERREFRCVSPVGLNLQHIIDTELPLDLEQPILRQRRFCMFNASACKPLLTRVPVRWATGFHTSDQPVDIDPDLFMFHLKRMDYNVSFNRHRLNKEMSWAQSSLEKQHGAHARYEYPRFVRESFFDPMNVKDHGVQPFDFSDEIRTITSTATLHDGLFYFPDFPGKIVEIPEHLRDAF